MRLKNKVCVITGSSSGIGAAIAKGYAKEGAKVVVTYNTQKDNAYKIAEDIGSELVVYLDVRDRSSIKEAFKLINDKYGCINVLVNNAGINRTADFDKQTEEEWNEVIDVNLTGPFRCSQEVLPYITDYGRIINIGSLSGEYGGPRTPSYAAAKMGLMSLTHNVARFLGKRNICVNTLSPGVIGNEFTEKTMSPEVKETAFSLMLIKRFARVEEMVGAAIFLASDESSYMTAQTLSINGGAWVKA
ncbi:MAG: 3-oxoacyl-ACP reductase FabG [Campylobacteraceae bacterium]|nr:3-oxoacyl-ACP reductase FabG [Campylobacteraceae bacterium]